MISPDEAERRSAARVGSWIAGTWMLDALIGMGGMAAVYSATHRNGGNRAAIKILYPELANNATVRERFQREGYAANVVAHPGVVRILDDGVTEDGLAFLVMDLLEGDTLERLALAAGGKLEASEVVERTDAVLDILGAAHARSVIHRDIKPDNLFLTRDGFMKVLDFGLARVDEPLSSVHATHLGGSMGTPGFMSPEQARGDWDAVDARSDLWALGASMFTLLSGRVVHDAANPQKSIVRAATTPAPSLALVAPALPSSLTQLVDRALAFNPRERFQTAASMRQALRYVRNDFAPRAPSRVRTIVTKVPEVALSNAPSPKNPASEWMNPVEIAPDTYWVGKRDPKAIFHSNPYLRIFRGPHVSGGHPAQFNLLVDPGSSSDFAVVSAKVSSLIGSLDKVSALHINHQDPDVGSSAFMISARFAPRALILSSEATWRLIVHFNLPRERFVDLDKFAQGFRLPTGHTMIPVPSPFCHFRGAVMLYDHATRVLFSGDLFGGVTTSSGEGLWADETDWPGMRAFHQAYMPTQRALSNAVAAVRKLDPPVEIIAPQHGRLWRGAMIDSILERIEHLPVGLDVMEDATQGADMLVAWNSVLHRIVRTAQMILGADVEQRLLDYHPLQETLIRENNRLTVTSLGRWTVSIAVAVLTAGQPPAIANPIKLEAILACEELDLPALELRIEEAEGDPSAGVAVGMG
ncbi:MAG: protein kinase [Polyangiaceae bacterium]|nr:protein kinase [Polyangiaceae bacterium]